MKYIIFSLQNQPFGIDIHLVHEFSKAAQVSPILGQDPKVAGLINLRGRITLAIDLVHCFKLEPAKGSTKQKRMIVLESQENLSQEANDLGVISYQEPLILLVDQINEVIEVEPADFHPAMSHQDNDIIEALVQVNDQLIPLIGVPQLIHSIA